MEYVALGKTNLLVSRTAFGAESLDCREIESFGDAADEKACAIVHQAYAGGMNFFDTSHSKPNCESRLGAALHGIRHNVILATKTSGQSLREIRHDLEESLMALESDTLDLFQLENPLMVPRENGMDGIYQELVSLKQKGVVKHIGIATDNYDIARETVECGLYEVVQFPFSMISPDSVRSLVKLCQEKEIGCIASQPLNGGVVNNIPLAFGFLHQFENVVPVWGTHTQEELQQILFFNSHPPVVDESFESEVKKIQDFFN
ncbi:aldo/keto reductase [Treponema sp.]|uniref:aldo/keto reductase n=1 Tax=Treponema sp. TaxID=166 RepID=UPI003F0A458F